MITVTSLHAENTGGPSCSCTCVANNQGPNGPTAPGTQPTCWARQPYDDGPNAAWQQGPCNIPIQPPPGKTCAQAAYGVGVTRVNGTPVGPGNSCTVTPNGNAPVQASQAGNGTVVCKPVQVCTIKSCELFSTNPGTDNCPAPGGTLPPGKNGLGCDCQELLTQDFADSGVSGAPFAPGTTATCTALAGNYCCVALPN